MSFSKPYFSTHAAPRVTGGSSTTNAGRSMACVIEVEISCPRQVQTDICKWAKLQMTNKHLVKPNTDEVRCGQALLASAFRHYAADTMKSVRLNPDEKLLHKHALELKRQGPLLSSASLADVLKGELKETFGGEAVNVYPLGSLVRASWRCLSPNAVFDGNSHVRIHWSDSIAVADADDAMSTTGDNDNNDSYKNDFEAAMRLNGIDEQQIIHEHLPANGSGGNVDSTLR